MRKMQCELCGGIEILKNDQGFFQCQSCGCQYTLEQAKALIGTVIINNYAAPEKSDFVINGGILRRYTGNDERVVIPDGVVEIGERCFSRNLTLKEVIIPNTVQSIAQCAFSQTPISSVQLPDSITYIGDGAFSDTKIEQIVIPSSVKEMFGSAFSRTPLKSLTITSPNTVVRCPIEDYKELTVLDLSNASIAIDENRSIWSSSYNGIVNDCPKLIKLILPQTLQSIPTNAFCSCRQLKEITIPSSVKTICQGAFTGSSVIGLTIPSNVPESGINVDMGCEFTYRGVKYPNSLKIGEKKYYGSLADYKEALAQFTKKKENDLMITRVKSGLCRHCGGKFKGIFKLSCSLCGKSMDYYSRTKPYYDGYITNYYDLSDNFLCQQ